MPISSRFKAYRKHYNFVIKSWHRLNSRHTIAAQIRSVVEQKNKQTTNEKEIQFTVGILATDHILRDEADLFTASGQQVTVAGTVSDNTKPFRVTVTWTDAPGPTSGNAFVNNLDLEVTVGGNTYKGNVFSGAFSTTGGSADIRDNAESVFIPAGVSGAFEVRIIATNIAGDGVPGNGSPLDQDFALVVYNAVEGPTPTPTPSPTPTGSPIVTPSTTPTATPTTTPCPGNQYTITPGADVIVPGDTDTGLHTDDGDTFVALPFNFKLYDQIYNGVNVNTNGRLDFVCVNEPGGYNQFDECLPPAPLNCPYDFAIFGLWEDMRTDVGLSGCSSFPGGNCGIFTSVSGSAPNRIFNIEWRTVLFNDESAPQNFEVRLYENPAENQRFDVIIGTLNPINADHPWVSGVQGDSNAGFLTQDFCIDPPGSPLTNVSRTYEIQPCGTPTPTPTPTTTPTPTATPTPSAPPSVTPTATPTATATATTSPTATPPRATPRPRPTPHPRPPR